MDNLHEQLPELAVEKMALFKMVKEMHRSVYIMLLLAALIGCVSAESWTGQVVTNTSSWQISRHSTNLSMDISGYVKGTISPVERQGRVLGSYAHYSEDVAANGVKIKERTAGYQGKYNAEEMLKMRSRISSVGYEANKPIGTSTWTVEFYADWPVFINSSRSIDYIGRNINDKELISNGEDNVGNTFLYNKKLSKEEDFKLSSRGLNATITATDARILNAELDEVKDLDYGLNVHSTGIADLKFKQSGSHYVVGSGNYEILSENEERYIGDYNITRKIRMKSDHYRERYEDDQWLPCCSEGWTDMNPLDKIDHNAESVFDCTCFKPLEGSSSNK